MGAAGAVEEISSDVHRGSATKSKPHSEHRLKSFFPFFLFFVHINIHPHTHRTGAQPDSSAKPSPPPPHPTDPLPLFSPHRRLNQ